MNFYEKNKVILWIAVIIIALLCGYLGSWVYLATISKVNSNDLINYNPNSSVVIRDARKVVIEQDLKVSETITTVQDSLVGIFKKNSVGNYNLTENSAQALIITSDGWLITDSALVTNNPKGYVVITTDRKVYEIDQAMKSSVSNFHFIHLEDAKSLPVLSFASTENLRPGQAVLAINWFDASWLSTIAEVDKNLATIKSSDANNQEIILQDIYGQNNFVLADLSSSIVGLVDINGKIKPMSFFMPAINGLLLDGKINLPKLGVNYINASLLVSEELQKGAMVKSVDKNSPAALAGILPNDLILSVNGEELDADLNLSGLIAEYQPGEKITLRYSRVDEIQNIEITLD
ncbi:MAG: S1C family serine protease [bacterium]